MISIITPVLNEEAEIGPFCAHLAGLQGSFECLVVDGGSTDGTVAEVRRQEAGLPYPLHLLVVPRGRAVQMNAGAVTATGEILLFLHADCRIPGDSLAVIEAAVHRRGAIGGGFTHSFAPPSPLLAATSLLGNLHARTTGVFFGDFGIFLKRDVFVRIGGYDTSLPYCEDAALCRAARNQGRMVQIPQTIVSSSRRYEREGRWRLTAIFAAVILLDTLGIRPGRFGPAVGGREEDETALTPRG
ncbi:MAG: TIGR04283 family arsenosugar biosynthesis glycosyltransferase [Methanomicrobiaceae archaeon]|nr:TIGR04283 family arsenosugar biosynthesis glycosyltransferase [Methanomicrobiaceae archaeon]